MDKILNASDWQGETGEITGKHHEMQVNGKGAVGVVTIKCDKMQVNGNEKPEMLQEKIMNASE